MQRGGSVGGVCSENDVREARGLVHAKRRVHSPLSLSFFFSLSLSLARVPARKAPLSFLFPANVNDLPFSFWMALLRIFGLA